MLLGHVVEVEIGKRLEEDVTALLLDSLLSEIGPVPWAELGILKHHIVEDLEKPLSYGELRHWNFCDFFKVKLGLATGHTGSCLGEVLFELDLFIFIFP